MLSHILLGLGPVGALAASAYAPASSTCPPGSLVRSADGISESEAAWVVQRKAVTDVALKSWLGKALPGVDASCLPTLALSMSGGGFRSLLTGAGVVQALDGRDSNSSTAGLYQALTYHAGLSGGGWLLSALAAGNWPTVSHLRDSVWEAQFAGGILNASSSTTVGDYQQIAAEIVAKGSAGFPVSLTDPWGRMVSYQIMSGSEGGVDTTMSDISSLSAFSSFNAPFPIVTASKITPNSGACEPAADEAIYEFNPFEFGSWSDDISAFVQSEYLGSNITAGSASSQCVTGFDNINWVLGTSSMLLNEYVCNASLGVDVTTLFPSALITVVEKFTPADEYGYSLLPNPFKGFTSTTATKPSTISGLEDLHIVDGGEADRNVPLLPLLEPTRNVSVIIVNDNSNDENGFPDGTQVVAAYEATRAGRLAGRFPAVPAAGNFSTSRAQFFGCDEPAAVTVVYLPNSEWTYASNTATLKLAYTAAETNSMISNGNQVATQGGDESWAACLACGIMLKEVGKPNLPSGCAACLAEYCWSA